MEIEIDNETKVVAILSGYIRELKEGKDYLETTTKTAETIAKIFSFNPSVSGSADIIKFGAYLTGHDDETIKQMLNDYQRRLR